MRFHRTFCDREGVAICLSGRPSAMRRRTACSRSLRTEDTRAGGGGRRRRGARQRFKRGPREIDRIVRRQRPPLRHRRFVRRVPHLVARAVVISSRTSRTAIPRPRCDPRTRSTCPLRPAGGRRGQSRRCARRLPQRSPPPPTRWKIEPPLVRPPAPPPHQGRRPRRSTRAGNARRNQRVSAARYRRGDGHWCSTFT